MKTQLSVAEIVKDFEQLAKRNEDMAGGITGYLNADSKREAKIRAQTWRNAIARIMSMAKDDCNTESTI